MAKITASLNRRDITASPVGGQLPYTSSFASNIFDAMSTGFKAYGDMHENDARDGLYEAQTRGVNLDNAAKQRQVDGNRLLAGIITKAQGDPRLAKFLVKTGLENDIPPEKLAQYMALFAGNTTEPVVAGQTNEQTIVGNRGVFADGLSKGESFDVNRAEGILTREDATDRYKSDNALKGTMYSADKSSGATIESANIRAKTDKEIASAKSTNGGSTTTYTGYDKLTRKDFDAYVDDAIAAVAGQGENYTPSGKVRGIIAQRAEQYMQQGEAPVSAAQRAARDVLTGTTSKDGKTELVQPGILSKPTTPEPTARAPRTKDVKPNRAGSPAAASAPPGASKPAPAAAPAPAGQTFDELPPASQYRNRRIRGPNGEIMRSDGARWIPEGA